MKRLLLAAALLAACTAPTAAIATPSTAPVSRPSPTPTSPLIFRVNSDQARLVTTTMRFFDAWNAGEVEAALGLVTDDVVGGDCDYRARAPIQWSGKSELAAWLRTRARDGDVVEIADIRNENPDPASGGGHVVGLAFARRTSDSLRALGRPQGIDPESGAKVVFTQDGRRISALVITGGARSCVV